MISQEINTIIRQLEADGHYELSESLNSYISAQQKQIEDQAKKLEIARKALEEIDTYTFGGALVHVQSLKSIARTALSEIGGSQDDKG